MKYICLILIVITGFSVAALIVNNRTGEPRLPD